MNNIIDPQDEPNELLPSVETAFDKMGSEELRQLLKSKQQEMGLSNRSMAAVTGIADGTLQAYRSGTYKGNVENVDAKVRRWLESTRATELLRASSGRKISFVQTASAEEHITLLRFAQTMPTIVTITGGAGVGKTTSAKHYRNTTTNVWMLTLSPKLSSASAVLEYVADELNINEASVHKRSRAVARRLEDTGGLLIFDEAQHATVQALEEMRALHDRAGVGLALVGNDTVWNRIDGGGRQAEFAQLFSRVGMQKQYLKPAQRDIADILNAHGIEDEAQRKLLATIGSKHGALRQMLFTLSVARQAAGEPEKLSVEHIQKAYGYIARGAAA